MDEHEQRFAQILAYYRSLPGDQEPFVLSEELLRRISEVEGFSCNRPGQDKSWVLRLEEADRRFFADLRRKPEA